MGEVKNPLEVRFKGFSEKWMLKTLGECLLVQRGGSPRPIETFITKDENGINWIKIGDVKSGSRYITKTKEKIISEGESKSRRVNIGDLILSNSMSFGRPYIMKTDGCIHDGWLLIRDESKLFDIDFLFQLLSSEAMLKQYKSLAAGGVVNNLNSDLVQSTQIQFPNKNEQKVIGTFFKNLDDQITLKQRQLDKLVTLKKAMLEKMFPKEGADKPEIRFDRFSGAWGSKLLDANADFAKGQGYSKSDLVKAGTPIVLYGRLYTQYESAISNVDTFVNVKPNSLFSKGYEVVVPASGETAEDIARASAILKEGILLGGDLNIIYPNEKFSPLFLALSLSNGKVQKDLSKRAQGKSVVHVRNSDLKELEINLPSIEEQKAIGNYFAKLDNLISLQKKELTKLKEIKSSCLEKMFV